MNLTILFTAIIAFVTLKTQVYGIELQQNDVDRILNALQDRKDNVLQIKERIGDRSSEGTSEDKDEITYGSLKNGDLLKQIRKIQERQDVNQVKSNTKNRKRQKSVEDKNGELFKVPQDYQEYVGSFKKRDSNNKNELKIQDIKKQLEKQIDFLEKYMTRDRKSKTGKSVLHHDRHSNYEHRYPRHDYSNRYDRNSHSPLTELKELIQFIENGNDSKKNNVENYTKILVILNPQAIQKSRNLQSLTDLMLRILSPVQKNKRHRTKQRHYKGFLINDELDIFGRRLNRDSKEIYAPRDTIEEDYKPKRSRGDNGSGRTAIPYIRHRGDIYERDN